MSELLPCPFCGSDDIRLRATRVSWFGCDNCGAEAGHAPTKKGVVIKWNNRSIRDSLHPAGVSEENKTLVDVDREPLARSDEHLAAPSATLDPNPAAAAHAGEPQAGELQIRDAFIEGTQYSACSDDEALEYWLGSSSRAKVRAIPQSNRQHAGEGKAREWRCFESYLDAAQDVVDLYPSDDGRDSGPVITVREVLAPLVGREKTEVD